MEMFLLTHNGLARAYFLLQLLGTAEFNSLAEVRLLKLCELEVNLSMWIYEFVEWVNLKNITADFLFKEV